MKKLDWIMHPNQQEGELKRNAEDNGSGEQNSFVVIYWRNYNFV